MSIENEEEIIYNLSKSSYLQQNEDNIIENFKKNQQISSLEQKNDFKLFTRNTKLDLPTLQEVKEKIFLSENSTDKNTTTDNTIIINQYRDKYNINIENIQYENDIDFLEKFLSKIISVLNVHSNYEFKICKKHIDGQINSTTQMESPKFQ